MMQLEKNFVFMEIYSPEDRATYVKWALGDDDKSRPFYYKEHEENKRPVVRHSRFSLLRANIYFIFRESFNHIWLPPLSPLISHPSRAYRLINVSKIGPLVPSFFPS